MGMSIALEGERGNVVAVVLDPRNVVQTLLLPYDPEQFPLLSYIDPYGETIFNNPQMEPFLEQWRRGQAKAGTPEEKEIADQVLRLAERCRDGVHLYLRFSGD